MCSTEDSLIPTQYMLYSRQINAQTIFISTADSLINTRYFLYSRKFNAHKI